MNVAEVRSRSTLLNHKCAVCERKLRPGDWALDQRMLDADGHTFTRFVVHVDCVRTAIVDAPDHREENMDQIRDELITLRSEIG